MMELVIGFVAAAVSHTGFAMMYCEEKYIRDLAQNGHVPDSQTALPVLLGAVVRANLGHTHRPHVLLLDPLSLLLSFPLSKTSSHHGFARRTTHLPLPRPENCMSKAAFQPVFASSLSNSQMLSNTGLMVPALR